MSRSPAVTASATDLRDKIVLVECHGFTLGFGARLVRQVGFPDLVGEIERPRTPAAGCPGHVGAGRLGDEPCSVWDLGRHLGLPAVDRAIVTIERAGGLVAFRTGPITSVIDAPRHAILGLPDGVSPRRPGLFRACLPLGDDRQRLVYLLRSSALLDLTEAAQARRDWHSFEQPGAAR